MVNPNPIEKSTDEEGCYKLSKSIHHNTILNL